MVVEFLVRIGMAFPNARTCGCCDRIWIGPLTDPLGARFVEVGTVTLAVERLHPPWDRSSAGRQDAKIIMFRDEVDKAMRPVAA